MLQHIITSMMVSFVHIHIGEVMEEETLENNVTPEHQLVAPTPETQGQFLSISLSCQMHLIDYVKYFIFVTICLVTHVTYLSLIPCD